MSDFDLNLKDIERRPQRYWNADGLNELLLGVFLLIWGVVQLLPQIIPAGAWVRWYWGIAPFVPTGGCMSLGWIAKRLKQRFTFSRGGYVRLKSPGAGARIGVGVAALVFGAGVVWMAIRGPSGLADRMIAPGTALVFAVVATIFALRLKLSHLLALALAAVLLAVAIAGTQTAPERGFTVLFLGLGPVAIVAGAVRLRLFLRANPGGMPVHG